MVNFYNGTVPQRSVIDDAGNVFYEDDTSQFSVIDDNNNVFYEDTSPFVALDNQGYALFDSSNQAFTDTTTLQTSGNNGYGAFSEPLPVIQNQNSTNSELGQPFEVLPPTKNTTYTVPTDRIQEILQGSGITPPAEGYSFDIAELTGPINGYLSEIDKINSGIDNVAYTSAQQQAMSAYIDAYIEAQATKKILEMNNQSTQANAILDQQQLALRQNYNILSKQTEMYLLDAQVREQLTNLFFSLEKTIMDNRFALAKTVVNSAKY